MTHPGVGPVTALAFMLTMGPAERFVDGIDFALLARDQCHGDWVVPQWVSWGNRNFCGLP